MTEQVSGYQAWIESEADQRVAESGPLRLDQPLESGFPGVIRTSVSSSWDKAGADIHAFAPTLIGTGYLLFAGRKGTPPEAGGVRKVVAMVIAGGVSSHPARWVRNR